MRIKLSNEQVKAIYESRIKRIAYENWKQADCPDGRDLEFWFDAEKQYKDEMLKFYGNEIVIG